MENSSSSACAGPENRWQLMDAFTVDRLPGNERLSAEKVAQRLADLYLSAAQMEQLTQAVAAAVLHVIEHNPVPQSEPLMQIQVMVPWGWRVDPEQANKGDDAVFDATGVASLSSGQLACCWGFFLVERSVDLAQADAQGVQHTINLFLYQEATGAHA